MHIAVQAQAAPHKRILTWINSEEEKTERTGSANFADNNVVHLGVVQTLLVQDKG